MEKIKKYILNNKLYLIILLLVFLSLFYCSLSTFIINDDLPYSFFYRTDVRVTNIIQVFKNQVADYFNISSRVFVHMIVQFLLIFGKNLWSVLNPIAIIISMILIGKIINIYIPKSNKILNFIVSISLFFALYSFKWLFYWVAGSVNYIWTSIPLLFFIYLYLKNGWNRNIWLNMLIVLIVSILHESLLIYMIVFVTLSIFYEKFILKNNVKKLTLLYIPLIISSTFLLLGPGTFVRINGSSSFNNLNIFEKLNLSLPIISINLFKLTSIYNLIPVIYSLVLLITLMNIKKRNSIILITLILLNIILSFIINNNWLYFTLVILCFISDTYINFTKKRYKLSIIHLSMLAVVYSMAITSDYQNARPNYFYYLYLIIIIIIMIYGIFKNTSYKKLIVLPIIILLFLLANEIKIYYNIGMIKNDRLSSIEKYKENKGNKDILYLKKVPNKYCIYQIDCNEPSDENYFAYQYFINYYKLPSDTKIKFK